ncbi:hypothetical protein [Candidatus Nitrospira bockiana]
MELGTNVKLEQVRAAIKGLKFRTNQEQRGEDEQGKESVRYVPVLREMTEEDVLKVRRDGDALIIVSKDGMKHRVSGRGGESTMKSPTSPANPSAPPVPPAA